jgi:xanthine dehydrogenase YagT iron-sulfur-binding subunit
MAKPRKGTDRPPGRVTRRGFIASIGAGAAAAATLRPRGAEAEAKTAPAGELVPVKLTINGNTHKLLVEPRWTLLFVLREKLAVTGTKAGCERGECGACTVLIDGDARYSCLTLALEAEGHEITTVEGLAREGALSPVQQAFWDEDAYQCGYCTPGQIVAAESLLRANANPGFDEIRQGMAGNLCRCGAYGHIFKAVAKAARERRGGGAS